MSEVNLQFTVNSFSSTVTLDSTNLTVTPEATQLTVYPGFAAFPPQGQPGNGQVTFNDAGLFGGSANFTYDKSTRTLTVDNANVTGVNRLGNIANVHINGGTTGQVIKTDGQGNLSFATLSAGGSTTQIQYNNNGEFAGVPSVTYSNGRLTLGTTSQVRITGGVNGYVLQTDGTGNLSWTSQTGGGGSGNAHPSGANTQVQFNDAGSFGADPGFTYDKELNLLTADNIVASTDLTVYGGANISGNVTVGNITTTTLYGNLASGTQLGITQVGTQGYLNVTGDLHAGNLIANTSIYGNLSTQTQANINQVGTLNTLNVTGNVTVGNISASLITGTLTDGNQPNITQVGTLASLGVTNDIGAKNLNLIGNVTAGGNVSATGNASASNVIASTSITAPLITISSIANVNGNINVTGTTKIQQAKEKVTVNATGATGTINYDVLSQAIIMQTANATTNFTLNIRGNNTTTFDSIVSNNESLTLTFINKNGSTAYRLIQLQIDGANVTPLYPFGPIQNGTANGRDMYLFNIVKTAANTYVVFGSYGNYS